MSDRDYLTGLCYAAALAMVHLSRIGEELVLWTSAEYGFAELDDSAATGSSMMPQKKNPDAAELVRGKAGTAIGRLTGLLSTLKGLPLAYNRDLQEDKRASFDQVDDLAGSLAALTVCVRGLRFDRERMAAAAGDGRTVATDLAEQLVREGVPFREAHSRVAARVAAGERFAEPTAEQAAAGRLAPDDLRAQLAAARAAVAAAVSELLLGGVAASALAAEFGTPLYVYDELELRARSRAYLAGLESYPGASRAVYACKANATVAVIAAVVGEGLGADVASAGELAAALRAGAPAGVGDRPRQQQVRRRPVGGDRRPGAGWWSSTTWASSTRWSGWRRPPAACSRCWCASRPASTPTRTTRSGPATTAPSSGSRLRTRWTRSTARARCCTCSRPACTCTWDRRSTSWGRTRARSTGWSRSSRSTAWASCRCSTWAAGWASPTRRATSSSRSSRRWRRSART